MQGTSDLDESGATIGRTYAYSGEVMTDYVVHPAFINGTDNNFKLGEWDEEVSGFWVAKYEAGYQANTITNDNGTLSIEISNSGDEIEYSDLNYTSYVDDYITNPLNQDLSSTGYSNENLSYPVFLPLTYSYNNICIGDSYVLSQAIDAANNFYGLNSSTTDSHMMKNSEWGAVAYLAQSDYGRDGIEITKNNYYTSETTPYKVAVTGLAGNEISSEGTTSIINVNSYDTQNGMKASTTGNVTGIYDLNGGTWERLAGYISNGNNSLIRTGVSQGSSGGLMGATNIANSVGYLTLSTRLYTVYPYDSISDENASNYNTYKKLLSNTYGYGDAILETSNQSGSKNGWYSNYSNFANLDNPFFTRGGYYKDVDGSGIYSLFFYLGYR